MTRILRTLVTFALLVAGSIGYEHAYVAFASRFQPPESGRQQAGLDLRPSVSVGAQQASELALRVFGEHHWTSGSVSDVTRYYNVERGYWMYWSSFDFPDEHDRKRIVLAPFAVIWGSNKDGSIKVMSGDRAIIDFDQPFNLLGTGPKASVVHAKIEGIGEHVMILDDKATPDPADDLIVTMPYAEYFEKQMQIRCDEQVRLVEGGYTVDGRGLVIALRPSESSGGFPGAEVVTLNERVVITADDVGSSGILPGSALPEQQLASADGDAATPLKTPGKISCDGPFRMQMPKPRLPARVGPPAPGQPTIAEFSRNVVIERGVEQPDRITGDHLYALLIPRDPPPPTEAGPGADPEAGASRDAAESGGGLRLLEARVDGHVVWLESLSERVRCRGNELIYRKPKEKEPEVTYFRANPGRQIEFERTDPDGRLVTILSSDATLHGDPDHKGRSTIIARGPGQLEMRSAQGAPVDRSATWRDEMVVETSLASAEGADDASRTYITLQGWPILNDPKQLTLAARDKVVACLLPRPAVPTPGGGASAEDTSRSYRIEWVSALGDVHMVTPEGVDGPADSATATASGRSPKGRRELNAREKLDVVFSYLDDPSSGASNGVMASRTGQPGAARAVLASQASPARTPGAPDGAPNPGAAPPGVGPSGETVVAEVDASEPSRPFSADADLVWARIEVVGDGPGLDLTGSTGGTREVREARLRRNVVIHQDPAPGKEAGFHVEADHGVDLQNIGPGRLKVYAHGEQRPVTVASDDFYIQGFPDGTPDGKVVLGVDQAHDYAFVQGPGRLWNLSNPRGMGRLELASDDREESPDENREPLIITWEEAMIFHGQYAQPDSRQGPARALFLGDVKSRHGDSGALCQEMEAIFDRSISFDRALPGQGKGDDAGAGSAEEQGRVQIDSVICNGRVELWSLVRDGLNPASVRELRQAFGDSVTYDRPADRFWADGAGTVSVATLDDGKGGVPEGLRVVPTSYQAGAAGVPDPNVIPAARPRLSKLRVDFNEGLEGQLGTAGGGYRVAEFRGDARALRAPVEQFRDELDFDRPPADAVRLDGDSIYVEHMPEVTGIPERTFLKAFGTAQARSSDMTLISDAITFDSNTGLIFARGTAAAPVAIASQEAFGQPTSRTSARTVMYNTRSGESESIEPGPSIFVRPRTGYRLGNSEVAKEVPEAERERPRARLPARNDMERQGFTGN